MRRLALHGIRVSRLSGQASRRFLGMAVRFQRRWLAEDGRDAGLSAPGPRNGRGVRADRSREPATGPGDGVPSRRRHWLAQGPCGVWRRHRSVAAIGLHVPPTAQDRCKLATRKSHHRTALDLCAAWCIAKRMGAQHSASLDTALFHHLPKPVAGCRAAQTMTRVSKLPKRLQPMLATLTDAPFDDPDWVFETKWDGFRMVACLERGKVTLYSRNGKIISDSYRPVAEALERLKADAVLDGELVALDRRGVSHFQLLQNALRAEATLRYAIFDLLFLDGEDLRGLPLVDRKAKLRRLVPKHPLLSFSPHRPQYGVKFFKEAADQGLEGIMAKRKSSKYLSGARTTDWLKIKTARRQEVVIAGFTAPRRSRPHFGALVLALRDGKGWRYIGHVGTGFSHQILEAVHGKLLSLSTPSSPLGVRVKDEGVTTWVKPKLVAEVKFTEWTSAGEMRHPVFLGLREDKRPEDVTREKAKARRRR